jgi:hypothetical protein
MTSTFRNPWLFSLRSFLPILGIVGLMSVSLPQKSFAIGITDVSIHGFLSQGYLLSSANDYLVNSEEGSANFNEAGLNFTCAPSTRLRLGMQLLSRDMGDEGNHKVTLDWGYGDYRWRDDLGVRIGKIRQTLGLYNKNRDLDMLRTSALLPQGIYNERLREFELAIDGISVYGFKPLGIFGDANYEIQYGSRNIPSPDADFWESIYSDLGNGLAKGAEAALLQNPNFPPGSVHAQYTGTENRSVASNTSMNTSLIWDTPLPGLRFGNVWASTYKLYANGLHELSINIPTGDPQQPTLTMIDHRWVQSNYNINIYTLSGEYSSHGWILAAEYFRVEGTADVTTDTTVTTDIANLSYYGRIGYQATPWLALGSYYSVFYDNPFDKEGKHYAVAEEAWQKDLAVSSRFDITPAWIAKLEVHFMDGFAQVDAPTGVDDRERTWTLWVLKNTFHF